MNVNAVVLALTGIVIIAVIIDLIVNAISYMTEPKEIPDEVAARRMARDRIPERLDNEDHVHHARRAHPAGKRRMRLLDPAEHDGATDA